MYIIYATDKRIHKYLLYEHKGKTIQKIDILKIKNTLVELSKQVKLRIDVNSYFIDRCI